MKIALIGAGSVVFSKNLTGDILSYPDFRGATFSYMDIDRERLDVGAALCRKAAKCLGAEPRIEATTDRQAALDGADFVINMVQVGGFDATLVDFEIPRKYGLRFTIADTTGPGGTFRALRTFPLLRDLCRDMERLCPRAVLLNYANPMGMNMQTVSRTSGVRAVGLCHSVQGTFNQLMGYLDEQPEDVAFLCAGINHMAFYLRIEKAGVDLYPRLFEAMSRPDVYNSNKVRFELMRRLGHFVTESSEHSAEYSPWFIPHGEETTERLCVPIDEYLRRCDGIVSEFERMKRLCATDEPVEVRRSHEYGSTIIHAMATGRPAVVYANMPNRGAIRNLPADAIAEAPAVVDRNGVQFTTVGDLPPQLLAYMSPHVAQQELFIRAALEGRRDHIYQAAMFDPLTAATLPPDRIVEMCDELIAAHGFARDGGCLPDLDTRRTLVPNSGKSFAAVDGKELRASWDRAQKQADADFIADWHVIGPFPAHDLKHRGLQLQTPIEAVLNRHPDGAIDLAAEHEIAGLTLRWTPAVAGLRGFVDLGVAIGCHDWSVAYGYAEVQSIHGREAVLRIGSDDGVKVWLNGKPIHEREIGRAYRPGGDRVVAYLQPGVNRILVKVDNYTAGWGFGVAVPKPNF